MPVLNAMALAEGSSTDPVVRFWSRRSNAVEPAFAWLTICGSATASNSTIVATSTPIPKKLFGVVTG